MAKTWNIVSKGRMAILRCLKGYRIRGTVESIDFMGFHQEGLKGVCTFNVRFHGLSGGNFSLEMPMAFDAEADHINPPVIVFTDGQAVPLSQGLFDRLLERFNLTKKHIPKEGWMVVDPWETNLTQPIINPSNKYLIRDAHKYQVHGHSSKFSGVIDQALSGNNDFTEAFKNFLICMAGSPDTIVKAMRAIKL